MQQFQFEYRDEPSLKQELDKIRRWAKTREVSKVLFHIYTVTVDAEKINGVCSIIKDEMPDALYAGSSANGSIIEGKFANAEMIIVCSLFEYSSTQIMIMQEHLSSETAHDVANKLIETVEKNPWVTAVEMLVTIRGMSMTGFCNDLKQVRESVQIYGGGAFNPDINDDTACVFSSVDGCAHQSVVFILYGGDDLNVYTMHVTGWKPLGRAFQVTKAKSSILYELDGRPAYEAYYKYLNIKNDEHFFKNTLEFPFFYQLNGINILRAPIASNPDGSLTMTSDMTENVSARIAYGDPKTILDCVKQEGHKVKDFQPEAIQIFSCAARRTFWGKSELSKETLPFQSMAATSGFYTSGEFLRTNGHVNQHNVTLVVAAMREGKPAEERETAFEMSEETFSGKVSMISRLATFIEAATAELNTANKMLKTMAVSDNLTLLFSRSEIQNRIIAELNGKPDFALVMFDLDNMKKVNAECGNKEGNNVIREISNQIQYSIAAKAFMGSAGRWDGDEFMVLLPQYDIDKAKEFADLVKTRFEKMVFAAAGHVTVSVGVTQANGKDTIDTLCAKLNQAIDQAKLNGRSRIEVVS